MSPGERKPNSGYKNNNDLTMKTFANGGATVIWSKKQYIDKTHRKLNDRQAYALFSCSTLQLIQTKLQNTFVSALLHKWLVGGKKQMLTITEADQTIISVPISGTEPPVKYIDFH